MPAGSYLGGVQETRAVRAWAEGKLRWAAAITLANSIGLVPIIYFRKGRRAS